MFQEIKFTAEFILSVPEEYVTYVRQEDLTQQESKEFHEQFKKLIKYESGALEVKLESFQVEWPK